MDKATLEAYGFSMVPEANIKLNGVPQSESQEITLTVQVCAVCVGGGGGKIGVKHARCAACPRSPRLRSRHSHHYPRSCPMMHLQAGRSIVQPGPLSLTLPLLIKGGPTVLVTLAAHVVVPHVQVSTSSLDFGSVAYGHCKVGGQGILCVRLQQGRSKCSG